MRAFGAPTPARAPGALADQLTVAGDALAAGVDEAGAADHVVRLVAEATGSATCLLWRVDEGAAPLLLASRGGRPRGAASVAVERTLRLHEPVALDPLGEDVLVTLQLGQPPLGALQLLCRSGAPAPEETRAALAAFGVRAAQALQTIGRARGGLAARARATRALL